MTEGAKILIVDDNEAGRYLKRRTLEEAGHLVSEAREGLEALRDVVVAKPDLIVLDVNLPDITGIELCRKLRANQVKIGVLMTSAAFTDPLDRVAALESGADSYLIEPIDPNELLASVRALLRMSRAEQELRSMNDTLAQRVADRTRELAEIASSLEIEKRNAARAEEALWHTQRLEAIGRLTGGIAHDFNNLLTVVLGNLELTEHELRRFPDADKLLRHVRSGHRAASDCVEIVRQLLVFARRDGLRQQVVDINKAIGRLEDFVRRSVGEEIALELFLGVAAAPCKIDPAHFEAAVLNLAINARDAMPGGGKLTIMTKIVEVTGATAIDTGSAPMPTDVASGDYVSITIADTGLGMSEDIASHVFEPFFTTKDIGKGSGLGLSQVFGFVKQSGGFIALHSAAGQGTRFGIFLPLSPEAPRHAAAASPAPALPRGEGTVLIVEDNDLVLDYVAAMTSELGYRVLRATSSGEALDVIRRGEPINLLFTDVVMPNGMSGVDLALEARRLLPDVKVLITSGYPGRALSDKRGAEFMSIVKPYSSADLANRLREALNGA